MSTPQEMMQIGQILVEHCQSGREADLMQNHYAPDAVSIEAVDMPMGGREAKGLEAILAKGEWWTNAHEVHSSEVEGPFVHGGNQFSVIFDIDVTNKESGERVQMREIGTYHVENGKIVREEFSYPVGE